jgi:hypothetical protein
MGGATGQTIEPEYPTDEIEAVGGGGSESTTSTKVDRQMGMATTLILPLVLAFTPNPQVNVTTDSSPPPNQAMMQLLAYTQNDASMAQPVVGTPNATASADKAIDQARTRLNIVNEAMKGIQAQGSDQQNNVTVAPMVVAASTTMLGAGLGSQVTALQQTSTYSYSFGSGGGTESKSSKEATPTYTLSPGPSDATTVAMNATPTMPMPAGMNGGPNNGRSISDGMEYASASLSGVAGINIADMTKFKNDAMSVLPAAKTIFERDPETTYRAQRLEIPKSAPSIA